MVYQIKTRFEDDVHEFIKDDVLLFVFKSDGRTHWIENELNTLATENAALHARVRELEAVGNWVLHTVIHAIGKNGERASQSEQEQAIEALQEAMERKAAPASDEPAPVQEYEACCEGCGEYTNDYEEIDAIVICHKCSPVVQPLDTIEWLKSNSLADFEASHEYGTYAIASSHNELCCYHCGDPHTKLGFIDEMVLCEQCIDLHIAGDMDWLTQDTGSEAPDA